MKIEIGKNIKQPKGFTAFIPNTFPQKGIFEVGQKILNKASEAERLIGKLDGITFTLPDIDFFLKMFEVKDAEASAQIEGTKATMIDALELDAGVSENETDAEDILFYIKALHFGIKRLKRLPLSLRFIKELHFELMNGARSTHFSNPGEFRNSQNWIGGTTPSNADYVPPPVSEMKESLNDFEKYLYKENITLPLLHIAIAHSQFETIHPFLDGNGRTGRLLITMMLLQRKLLEIPVLFLSSYFRKHKKVYYLKLDSYHNGKIEEWVEFFLDGIIESAKEAIEICKRIRLLRDKDMSKIQTLAKRESESGILVLSKLYGEPIVTSRKIMEWTNYTRAGATRVIERFVDMKILYQRDEKSTYDRSYVYRDYLKLFYKEN